MVRKSRCMFGCDDFGAYMHRFPNPQRRSQDFTRWTLIVGTQVQELDPMRVYKNKRVCDYHFKTRDKTSGHHLIHSAVPTLNLQGVFRSAGNHVQVEHNYCTPRIYFPPHDRLPQHEDVLMQPSTSTTSSTTKIAEHITVPCEDVLMQPSTSTTCTTSKTAEHITGAVKSRCSQGTIQKEVLRQKKENRRLKSQLLKMKRKKQTFKARLAEAEKVVLWKKIMKKYARNMIYDKLHRGSVLVCVGLTLYGSVLLGDHFYKYFMYVKPEREAKKLAAEKALLAEGSSSNLE